MALESEVTYLPVCTLLSVLDCTVKYFVLYCIILYCASFYCTAVLYSIALYCIVLHCTALYCTELFHRASKSEESGYDSDTRRSVEALSGRREEEEEEVVVDREVRRKEEGRGSDSSGLGLEVEPYYKVNSWNFYCGTIEFRGCSHSLYGVLLLS